MRCTTATALLLSVPHRSRPVRLTAEPVSSGYPISPELGRCVLLRYFYDGGTLKQGRLCQLTPASTDAVSGLALLHALHDDGVDLERFYPCVRETAASGGGWLRFLRGVVGAPPAEVEGGDVTFPLAGTEADGSRTEADGSDVLGRIDLKLFRRESLSADEIRAGQVFSQLYVIQPATLWDLDCSPVGSAAPCDVGCTPV